MKATSASIRRLNDVIVRAVDPTTRARLIRRKERLIDAMMSSCRHDLVFHTEAAKSLYGPVPARFCPACGLCEHLGDGPFKRLRARQGRRIKNARDFTARLRATLRETGIDL